MMKEKNIINEIISINLYGRREGKKKAGIS